MQTIFLQYFSSWTVPTAALTRACMDFSGLFIRNWRRITSGPTLKLWQHLEMEPCLLRSLLKSQDTLKYRFLVSARRNFLDLRRRTKVGRDRWAMSVNKIYWPAGDSLHITFSCYIGWNSTGTQHHSAAIQHWHLQEVSALREYAPLYMW